MSVVTNNLLLTGDDGYQISRSVRLRSSASAYFNRAAPASSTNTTWTFSAWVKRGKLSADLDLFGSAAASSSYDTIYLNTSDQLTFFQVTSGSIIWQFTTTQLFRDPSAWYHIVIAYDSTQATSTNRVKIYINGLQITAFAVATYPSLNGTSYINSSSSSLGQFIGRFAGSAVEYFDGHVTEINMVSGQQLTPSSFGENDSITGVWKPKRYSGTYGTNGFYLNFKDPSSTTTIGYDYSGNSNNWTSNNVSVTSGVTYDSMLDVPTLGATSSNYCVLNPLFKQDGTTNTTYGSMGTPSQANLQGILTAGQNVYGTISTSANQGKWYAEFTASSITSDCWFGFMPSDGNLNRAAWISATSGISVENASKSTAGFAANDIIGIALDTSLNTIQFYKNGSTLGSTYNISAPIFTQYFWCYTNSGATVYFNFGQRPFSYTPPTGFKALNTYNLPDATIKSGNKYFDVSTYTGTGATQSIVNSGGFQPDLIWNKARSNAAEHLLTDSVRGNTKTLNSNGTAAEETVTDAITAFNSNGFTLGANTQGAHASNTANYGGYTYVGWQWKANGSAVSNTSGTITAQVSAGATQGFSVVTYTGNGSASQTVGHGLGVAPSLVIFKTRSAVDDWLVYSSTLGASKYLYLDSTAAAGTAAGYFSGMTSSVIGLGYGASSINGSGRTFVAYCFAEVAGYSKFGSYTGNGSADGPFVYTGFRPRWIMVKRTDTGGYSWYIYDSSRNTYNVANLSLLADTSSAEGTQTFPDLVSNGIKIKDGSIAFNASGGTYIYACFAENPFKNSLAR